MYLITNSTLYPMLHEISTKPHLRPEELEHCSETLSKRSTMITNGLLAIIGITLTASSSPSSILSVEVKVSFVILAWCQTNRLYYEGLPVNELQLVLRGAFRWGAYRRGRVGRNNPDVEYARGQLSRDEIEGRTGNKDMDPSSSSE
ncbi:hypothetical protein DL96DRAFT_1566784 [Flagelloscypha sp. PMI_526]|nr:hypothetical protein DL96DRAFT_1566784 [Flagelloscypha sp. PMI_526]